MNTDAELYCGDIGRCANDRQLDAFHDIEAGRRQIILCKSFLDRLSYPDNDKLKKFADTEIEIGVSLNEFRDNSLAAVLAREVLLTGVRDGPRKYPSYDYILNGEIVHRFSMCQYLAEVHPTSAVTNADSIILFGIGQSLSLSLGIGVGKHYQVLLYISG